MSYIDDYIMKRANASSFRMNSIPVSFPSKGSIGRTGDWRIYRPVINHERCSNCGFCWMYCPEGVIQKINNEYIIDYEYCKGCGICANQCRTGSIKMLLESGIHDLSTCLAGLDT